MNWLWWSDNVVNAYSYESTLKPWGNIYKTPWNDLKRLVPTNSIIKKTEDETEWSLLEVGGKD